MPQKPTSPKEEPSRIDAEKALSALNLKDDAELDLDQFENELIKQTKFAQEMGYDKAKLFFRGMISQESGGNEGATGVNPRGVKARGKWQISEETAKSKYNLDPQNPALNRFMGVDYWNEGYDKAKEFSQDPIERAAIATSYYHGGDGALKKIRQSGGKFSSVSDGGATTNDHVYTVMMNWKSLMDKEGLDFTPATETPSVISLLDETPTKVEQWSNDWDSSFTGTTKATPNIPASGPKLDPRDPQSYYSITPNFNEKEKEQFRLAQPKEREEMILSIISRNIGGDHRKGIEALKRFREYEPEAFAGLVEQAQVGNLGDLTVGSSLPRLVKAYQQGGAKKFDEELLNVNSDQGQYILEQEKAQQDRERALSETSQSFRNMEKLKQTKFSTLNSEVSLVDDLDIMAASGFAGAAHSLIAGATGVAGIVAGNLGLDELDRELTRYSLLESDKARVIQEEQDLIKKRSMIPGAVLSAANQLGALPVQIGSYAAGGVGGVYLTTLAQSSKEEPLKALLNSQLAALGMGLGAGIAKEGASLAAIGKGLSLDSAMNALQSSPDVLAPAATLLYAKQNPGKVSEKELQQAQENLSRAMDDFLGATMLSVASGATSVLSSKKGIYVNKSLGAFGEELRRNPFAPWATKEQVRVERRAMESYLSEVGTKRDINIPEKERQYFAAQERQGGISSIAAITQQDSLPIPLVDQNGDPLGKVVVSVDPIPSGEGLHLVKFTDAQGRILPSEVISQEGAIIYQQKLARIGELTHKGASPEEITQAIIEAQPTQQELSDAKVEVKLANVEKEVAQLSSQAERLSPTTVKIGDRLWDHQSQSYGEVIKVNKGSVRLRLEKDAGGTTPIETTSPYNLVAKQRPGEQPLISTSAKVETPPPSPLSAEENFQSEVQKFDKNLAEFNRKKEEIKAQLERFKKFSDEPQIITQMRKDLSDSASGSQMNMGANVLQQAIVTGYDLYRTIKEAGQGFAEWLREMTQLVSPEAHPYLPDVWEKIQFLNDTKTRGTVMRGEDGSWKFEGEPTKVYHATSAGFDEAGYRAATTKWYEGKQALLEEKQRAHAMMLANSDPVNKAPWIDRLMATEEKLANYEKNNPPPIEDLYRRGFDEFSIAQYGTSTDIGWYGIGIYFGDLDEAHKYAHGPGSNIRPNWVRIENPLVWEYGKDSSIQRWLRGWKMVDGIAVSPSERQNSSGWKLPQSIHDEAEAFVRNYLDTTLGTSSKRDALAQEITNLRKQRIALAEEYQQHKESSQYGRLTKEIEEVNRERGKYSVGSKGFAELTARLNELKQQRKNFSEYDTVEADVKADEYITQIDNLDRLLIAKTKALSAITSYEGKISQNDLHQLSRGITTIMKDKGYDGVFVIEEKAKGYKTEIADLKKSIANIEKDLQNQFNPPKQKQLLEGALAERKARLAELDALSDFRVKEYVAFSPDQILSTLADWTPRSEITGELHSPEKALRSRRHSTEAGFLNVQALAQGSLDIYEWAKKHGRSLNNFFVAAGKDIRYGTPDEPKFTLGQQLQEWTDRVNEINTLYPSASTLEKSQLTKEKNSLLSKMSGLRKQIAKNSSLATRGEAVANEWVGRLSAGAKSKLMLLKFYQEAKPLLEALGSNIDEYYRYRQQDRLEGVRDRYLSFEKMIPSMTDDDLVHAYTTQSGLNLYQVVKSMNISRPGVFDEANAILKSMETAAESGDFSLVRKQLSNVFSLGAQLVPSDVFPNYQQYRANNRLDQVNLLYKADVEDILRTKFEETDAMPSQHLGNDGLYFPLIAEEIGPTGKLQRKGFSLKRLKFNYAKPKSPASHFTTGLSESYTADIKKLQETLARQIRAGDRAGLLQVLLDTGTARELQKVQDDAGRWVDDEVPDGYVKREIGSSDRVYSTKKEITLPTGEKVKFEKEFSQPIKQIIVPEALDKEINILLQTEGYSERQLKQAIGAITAFNLVGPLDGVIHGWNVLDGLRSRLGILPTNVFSSSSRSGQAIAWLGNTAISSLGKAPNSMTFGLGRAIYSIAKGMEQGLLSKDTVKFQRAWNNIETSLASGMVPERIGESTMSPEVANATGARLVGPLQWRVVRKMVRRWDPSLPEPTRPVGEIGWKEGGFGERVIKDTAIEKGMIVTRKVFSTLPLSPAIFGYGGFDLRARMASAEAIQHYAPSMTPYEVFEASQLLGVYNRFAESEVSRFLKSTQLSPFYSAASSRVRRTFQAWTRPIYGARSGIMRDSKEDLKKLPLDERVIHATTTALSESMLAYVTMWAITHHAATGEWPWEDENSRFMQIRVKRDDLNTSKYLGGLAPYIAPNPNEGVYLQFAPHFGGTGGGNLFGMNAGWKLFMSTMNSGATQKERFSEAWKAAVAQAATSEVHVLASSPLLHVGAKAGLGIDLAITREPQVTVSGGRVIPVKGGGFRTVLYQPRGKSEDAFSRDIISALWEMNGMLENFSEWTDLNPGKHETHDNPMYADVVKFAVQLALKNAIKGQENPNLTRAKNIGAIVYSRRQFPVQKGAAK